MEKLEDKLLKESWIAPHHYVQAKNEQERTKKSLYSILVKLSFLTEEDIYLFFAEHANIPFVRISDYQLDETLFRLFPEEIYRKHLFFPIFKIENILYVGMVNPLDTDFINTLEMQTGLEISSLFASPAAILEMINKFFGPNEEYFNVENLIMATKTENIPFWRESERLAVDVPVQFRLVDEKIKLVSSNDVSAVVVDFSKNGKAIGIKTFLFIPPCTKIMIKFPSSKDTLELMGEVIHCSMKKGGEYSLGVKFLEINEAILGEIFKIKDN